MPTYLILDTNTNEVTEQIMRMSELDEYLKNNPHMQTIIQAPAIVSMAGGDLYSKTPSGFKDVLSKVAEAHPSSPVGERYGKPSIKQARTCEVVKKHVKRVSDRINNK